MDFAALPIPLVIYICISVTTMLGIDTGQWLGFNVVNGHLSLGPHFAADVTSVMALSPVPPSWSVGIEMVFYLIAPFVVRRSIWLIASLCVFSLVFRAALMVAGFSGEPWNRALFPSELIYFLLGTLGYRLYLVIPRLHFKLRREAGIAVMVLGLAIIYWPVERFLRGSFVWDIWNAVPYGLIAAGIPFLFKLTKDSAVDANIGELSYPIYMCHCLVIGLIAWSPLNHAPFIGSGWPRHIVTIALVIVAAFVLDRLVALPVDRIRLRFGAKRRIGADTDAYRLSANASIGTAGR